MSCAQAPFQALVLPFQPARPRGLEAYPPMPQPDAGPARERELAIDAALDALSAALAGDGPLCSLRQAQTLNLCEGRPALAQAALSEIERTLEMEVIARHLGGCHKRRRLHRELSDLAERLRDVSSALPTASAGSGG